MKATESISISFLGVDERSVSAYEMFFKNTGQVNYKIINDFQKTQLCLVDRDAYNIEKKYASLIKAHPEIYTLFLSVSDYTCKSDKEFFVKKPVKRDIFQDALRNIYSIISGKPVQNTEQSNIVDLNAKKTQKASPIESADKKIEKKIISKNTKIKISKNVVPFKESKSVSTASVGKLLKIENEEHFVGKKEDIDANISEQVAEVIYKPDMFLQAIIEQACKESEEQKKIIELVVLNHIFYFDHKTNIVYSNAGPGAIRPLCLIPHGKTNKNTIKKDSFRDKLNQSIQNKKNNSETKSFVTHSWDMESFLWMITLWTSRGRIPDDIDLNNPVYLKSWPNLTRLASIPHSVRISAFLYEQPCTLPEVARKLGIKQRYVFAFFSACKSIGIADSSLRKVDQLFTPNETKQKKNKSILSKLFNRLIKDNKYMMPTHA